jgi:hypothetical protein
MNHRGTGTNWVLKESCIHWGLQVNLTPYGWWQGILSIRWGVPARVRKPAGPRIFLVA